jgi:hypothetical protein
LRSFSTDQDSVARADSLSKVETMARLRKEQGQVADSLGAFGVMPAAVPKPALDSTSRLEGWRYSPPPRAANKAGMNRFAWNLRLPDAVGFNGMIMWAGGTFGPMIPSGTYSVRLTVGDKSETQSFAVLKDPRSGATQADIDEQYAFLIQIRDKTSEANNAVRTIRNIKAQLADRQAKIPAGRRAALDRQAASLVAQLSAVEEEIYQVRNRSGQDPLNFPIKLNNQIAALAGVVGGAEAKPTRQSSEVFKILSEALAVQTGKLAGLIDTGLPGVNRELERLGQPAITPSTAELVGEPES